MSAQTLSGSGGSIITLTDTSRFNIAVSGLPSSINYSFGLESIKINISHLQDKDIDCFLASPDGRLIELTTDNGGTGDHYTNTVFRYDASTSITSGSAPFTGNFMPEGQMFLFNNGQNPNGTWQLRVIDDQSGTSGSLLNWSMTFGNNPAHPFPFTESNLPIMVINTNGQNIVDEPKILCDMGLIDNGIGNRNHLADAWNNYSGKIRIEIRGSSSQSFPKKSFGFETCDSLQNNRDVSLLGMPTEHDWVLHASYSDKTLMRNMLSYQVANEMGHYGPRTRYVDVVINGEYKGIYLLVESIKRDKQRVDINKLNPTENSGEDLTGGYVIKVDKTTGSGGSGWYSNYLPINHNNGEKIFFLYDEPEQDSITVQQKQYIQQYVDSFENALNGSNFMDSTLGYNRFIGNNSFIDFFFANEISKNVDGYRISSYLYKDKNKTLKAGPVWDFDIAWGNANYCGGNDTTLWAYLFPCTGGYQIPFWWKRLLEDSTYTAQVKCRYLKMRQTNLSNAHLLAIVDSAAAYLNESKDWNFTVWPILGTYVWPNPSPQPTTYAGEIQNLKNWITIRMAWLDANMPGNCNCNVAVTSLPITCSNVCNGMIVANATSPYQKSYQWNNGSVNDTIENLCADRYIVTMTDAVGCSRTDSIDITAPSALTVTSTFTSPSCFNSCNGTMSVTANGGTAPYRYLWSTSDTTINVSNVCAGNYNCTITDSKGCTTVKSISVNNPVALSISTSANTISCNSLCDGSAMAMPVNGQSPFSYQWSSGQTTSSIQNLCSGNYSIEITDGMGCKVHDTIFISQPNAITVSLSGSGASCYQSCNASATVSAIGGTGSYSYTWIETGSNQFIQNNLCAGTYHVQVRDQNNCLATDEITFTEPQQIQNSFQTINTSCYGICDASITSSATGGTGNLSYRWLPSGETTANISQVCSGNYQIVISDQNSCRDTFSVSVQQPSAINVQLAASSTTCNSGCTGSIQSTVSNGTSPFIYSWSNGSTTSQITDLCAGNYQLNITDANGCTASAQANVLNNDLSASLSSTQPTCGQLCGGLASVNVMGKSPFTYLWNNGNTSATVSNLCEGNYSVVITDSDGCTITQTVTMHVSGLSVSMNSIAASCDQNCNGSASVNAFGTPPYNYAWSNSASTTASANGLCKGYYAVTVSDNNQCRVTDSVFVDAPFELILSLSAENILCSGNCNGSITAQAVGGTGNYIFQWTNGNSSSTINQLCAGNYSVTVTDDNGCTTANSVTLSEPMPLQLQLSHNDASCSGCSDAHASANVNGGTAPYNFIWTPGNETTADIQNIAAGTYTICITDANSCSICDSVIVLDGPSGWVDLNADPIKIYLYPNPLTDISMFAYTLKEQRKISLSVNDASGKHILQLANGLQLPGEYSLPMPRNALAAGIYFFEFRAGQYKKTGKIIVQ